MSQAQPRKLHLDIFKPSATAHCRLAASLETTGIASFPTSRYPAADPTNHPHGPAHPSPSNASTNEVHPTLFQRLCSTSCISTVAAFTAFPTIYRRLTRPFRRRSTSFRPLPLILDLDSKLPHLTSRHPIWPDHRRMRAPTHRLYHV